MTGIASILEKILLAAVVTEKTWMPPRRSRMDWALAALFVLLAAGGMGYLVLALDRYMAGLYPPYIGALSCTAFLFAAALAVAVVLLVRRKRAGNIKLITDGRGAFGRNIQTIMESAVAELEHPVRENPKTAVLLATLAGLLFANHSLKP